MYEGCTTFEGPGFNSHTYENACRKNLKTRTLDDLLKIQLDPSNKTIRLVSEPPLEFSYPNIDVKKAWELYSRMRAINSLKGSPYSPNYTKKFDKIRYWFHGFLLRQGIIL